MSELARMRELAGGSRASQQRELVGRAAVLQNTTTMHASTHLETSSAQTCTSTSTSGLARTPLTRSPTPTNPAFSDHPPQSHPSVHNCQCPRKPRAPPEKMGIAALSVRGCFPSLHRYIHYVCMYFAAAIYRLGSHSGVESPGQSQPPPCILGLGLCYTTRPNPSPMQHA